MTELRSTQHTLMRVFIASIMVAVLIAILYETGIFTEGILAGNSRTEFVWLVIMELSTLGLIPLSLRLFKYKKVEGELRAGGNSSLHALKRWGLVRLSLLAFPLVVNELMYYWFMKATFGYMAVILFLCFFFIVPTLERCALETKPASEEDKQ